MSLEAINEEVLRGSTKNAAAETQAALNAGSAPQIAKAELAAA